MMNIEGMVTLSSSLVRTILSDIRGHNVYPVRCARILVTSSAARLAQFTIVITQGTF